MGEGGDMSNTTPDPKNGMSVASTHSSQMYTALASAIGLVIGLTWNNTFQNEIEGTPLSKGNGYLFTAFLITIVGAFLILFFNWRIKRNKQKQVWQREVNFITEEKRRRKNMNKASSHNDDGNST